MIRIGIDIGGTKIEGVVLSENGKILRRERVPTNADQGYEHVLTLIDTLYKELTESIRENVVIGVCTPGSISAKTGRLKNSNTQCLIGQPIKEDIEAMVGLPIALDNDANCFAQAENSLGAAKGYHVVFGIIMGTGVGGGICFDGKVHRGHQYLGGEWGHSLLHPNGNPCYCGNRGCVETYISGTALEGRYFDLTGKKKPLKEIVEAPPPQWKREFLDNFGMAVSNVVNILDPDIIVLGGGVSNVDFLYSEGPQYVAKYCFNDSLETPIVKNKLGDSAGVFGAAYLEQLPAG